MVISQDFVEELHKNWLEYVQPIIQAHPRGLPFDVVRSLDWNGAKLNVLSAKNPRLVGIQGTVFAMTELQLMIVGADLKKWRVDRDGTQFEMIVDEHRLAINGTHCFNEDIQLGKKLQRKRSKHITRMKKKSKKQSTSSMYS